MRSDILSQSAPVMTIEEVADGLKVSSKTVSRLLRKPGGIHGIKVGGQWRIPVSEFERVLREGVGPSGAPA